MNHFASLSRQNLLALVDCNNFFCSCERVFNPAIIGKPVVVLSNNDDPSSPEVRRLRR